MLDIKTKEKDKVVIVGQKEIEKKKEHFKRLRPHKGHTLFEFDKINMELRKAEFEVGVIEFNAAKSKSKAINKAVIMKEGCIYVPALNKQNALRKLIKAKILIHKK